MDFSDRIKLIRNENTVSAVELAKRLNKSESAIRMWESGKSKPDADTLIELSKMFNCTTDYLLGLGEYRNMDEQNTFKKLSETFGEKINDLPKSVKKSLIEINNNAIKSFEVSGLVDYIDGISLISNNVKWCANLVASIEVLSEKPTEKDSLVKRHRVIISILSVALEESIDEIKILEDLFLLEVRKKLLSVAQKQGINIESELSDANLKSKLTAKELIGLFEDAHKILN